MSDRVNPLRPNREHDYLGAKAREVARATQAKYGCTAFFRKSDGEIIGVGWPCDPPHANRFQVYGIAEPFESQLAAENWLERRERLNQEEKSNDAK